MSNQVQPDSGEETTTNVALPPPHTPRTRISRIGVIFFVGLIVLLLILFTGLLLLTLTSPATGNLPAISTTPTPTPKPNQQSPTPTLNATQLAATPVGKPIASPTAVPPIFLPGNAAISTLTVPAGHYVIYQQVSGIYTLSTTGGDPQPLSTPGYVYSSGVRPILTADSRVIYAGKGVWVTDLFGGLPAKIADLADNQVITSLALSDDGKTLAWSTEPIDGKGMIQLYAGTFNSPAQVYQQAADSCPCFRIFGFRHGSSSKLLLSDDRGSHEAVQYGLWELNVGDTGKIPVQIIDGDSQQGPLLGNGDFLIYSEHEGTVPVPTDNSVPTDIASLLYANSLSIARLSGDPAKLTGSQEFLSSQRHQNNLADYNWVTTPLISPDGKTLIYVEFSTDAQAPYNRHSAIYTASLSGSGDNLKVGKPQLLVTSPSRLLELGSWFSSQDNRVITFFADGNVYALDIQNRALTTLAQSRGYIRILSVIGVNR